MLRRLRAGFAVIGDVQHFPGYCVLITDDPDVSSLTDLPTAQQDLFLADAALLARAVERVARRRDPAYRRINVEVQGNTDAFLHAHVTPRYEWEPQPHVRWPAGATWWDGIPDPEVSALGAQHDELRAEITAAIDSEVAAAGLGEGSIAGAHADRSENAPAQGVIPILRVFDAALAREFYVDVLGFVWDGSTSSSRGFRCTRRWRAKVACCTCPSTTATPLPAGRR